MWCEKSLVGSLD